MRFMPIALLLNIYLSICYGQTDQNKGYKLPTVGISVLVRNKAHTLPYFLTCLYNLDYPKDRLYLWLYSDFNEDDSIQIINMWVEQHSSEYQRLYITTNSSSGMLHSDETKSVEWTPKHFKHVIDLREKALEFSRKMWADYIFMIDADVFLTNPSTVKNLISKNLDVVAPMLVSDGLYSNFWLAHKCGMTEMYYYKRTDDYKPILKREKVGCFSVPMVHTAVLINMKTLVSDTFTYDPRKVPGYDGPLDDIIAFAVNAKRNDVDLMICNDEIYGYIPVPLEDRDSLKIDYEQLLNIKLLAISRGTPIPIEPYMEENIEYAEPWKFGCSEIYMINLKRRTERRRLMEMSFKELGMDVTHFEAVDGKTLDMKNLKDWSITLMPNYEDPYHKRPMKAGEVGCFLSHYYIWKEIVKKHNAITLVLEDDIQFVPYFRSRLLQLMMEIKELDWDLVYVGRKILLDDEEQYATAHTTKPLYSYWTLGYLITEKGARRLLDAKPLDNMLPVDEFLPIMFDQHPKPTNVTFKQDLSFCDNNDWKAHFPNRNLKAYSAAPLLVNPTHYTGQDGYISDTEDSEIVGMRVHHHMSNELSNETSTKKESTSQGEEIDRGNEKLCDCELGELVGSLNEHYCVMSECLSTFDCVLDGLSVTEERLILPCAAQRAALQLCYNSHTTQPLMCQKLVVELMECARNHVLKNITDV